MTLFFGAVFQELLEKLHGFFEVVVKRKTSFPKDHVLSSLMQLIPEAPGHYATILGFYTLRKRTSDVVDLKDEISSRSKKWKQHPQPGRQKF